MRDNSATPSPCPPPADNPADFAQTAATVPAGQILTQARALLEPGSPDEWDFNIRWARALLDRAIAEDPNTPPPMTQSGRPAAWANVRDELYPRLRGRGLTDEAALAAAERGADAAIVESRLVTLSEARRWGRPYVGAPVDRDEAERDAAMEVETDVLEISTLSTVVQLALDGMDLTRSTHQAAALHVLSDLAELGRRLATNWDAAFAKRGRTPRHTDEEVRS